MPGSVKGWLRISIFNLLIVSLIGVILRYKIAFSLPLFDQKYLLDGHSHFAFAGWISQILMVLMIHYLTVYKGEVILKRYQWVLWGNLLTAYGMLIFFPLQGYGVISTSFSTLSILNSWVFTMLFWKDLDNIPFKNISHNWFKAALVYNAVSALGAFALAIMMANKIIHQNWYLAAVYYFLHFQYNGWFFFACMGLFISKLEKITADINGLNTIFWLFFLACVPAYFLSALWMPIPEFIYWLVVVAALAQVLGWILLVKIILDRKSMLGSIFNRNGKWMLVLSAIALTVKLLLQLISTHPALSQLAFGFRPIVIGYLHLVLLGVITIFILGYIVSIRLIAANNYFRIGLWIFISGIILNEILLMLQGVTGFSYSIVPFTNEALLGTAILMFSGVLIFNLNLSGRKNI